MPLPTQMPIEVLRINLAGDESVSALLMSPPEPKAGFVFAHGAGAGMTHAFMAKLSTALADRRIATLRFQFPYMEKGSKRPDLPPVAHAAVRAAVSEAAARLPGTPLFAGGKSFGARMTSQTQSLGALPGIRGLVFVGFPLHPAGKPGVSRTAHLASVEIPMLFLQGTRDELADLALIRETAANLRSLAKLHEVEGADHSFHVLVRSGRTDDEVMDELANSIAEWTEALA